MDNSGQSCAECLAPVNTIVNAQNGAHLCPQCAEQFYRPCAGCGGLIPQDDAVLRDGAFCCVSCLVPAVSDEGAAALSDAELSALVAEFIQLHAEVKQLNDRLDAVKEQLKRHAASQPRVANAVLLRTGEGAVKCGYSVRVSYYAEKLAAVEAMLGPELFAALFARKITFSAVKEPLTPSWRARPQTRPRRGPPFWLQRKSTRLLLQSQKGFAQRVGWACKVA